MTSNNEPAQAWRRKKVLVDTSLQGALIVAFVVLECLILCAAIGYLYWRFGSVLDNLMYQTHFDKLPDVRTLFLEVGIKVIAACTVANGVALLVADRLWNRYVAGVRKEFVSIIARVAALDFRQECDSPGKPSGHEVVSLANQWWMTERQNLNAINGKLAALEAADTGDRNQIACALSELAAVVNAVATNDSRPTPAKSRAG